MAILVKDFVNADGQIFESAYLKIQKVVVSSVDYEFFEKVNDDNVSEKLSWTKRFEASALVYIWCDEDARLRRSPIHGHFSMDFTYDLGQDPFSQSYAALRKNLSANYVDITDN